MIEFLKQTFIEIKENIGWIILWYFITQFITIIAHKNRLFDFILIGFIVACIMATFTNHEPDPPGMKF